MKTIGLIGGMSWESTAVYYRLINQAVRARLGGLHSAEIVLRSLDFEAVARLQRADRWNEAGALLARAGASLAAAGADCVLICTNTMHLVADTVAAGIDVPLLNVIDETGSALAAAGHRRPLLLATRYTMEHGFYTDRLRAGHGIDALVPEEHDRVAVHGIIFEELCQGVVLDQSRARLMQAIGRGMDAGADSVILGCTELCLLFDADALPCPGLDSTAVHAAAAVNFAFSEVGLRKAA